MEPPSGSAAGSSGPGPGRPPSSASPSADRPTRRLAAIERRRALSPSERRDLDAAICERLIQTDRFSDAHAIGLYLAVGGEVDPAAIGTHARSAGRTTWYPIVDDDSSAMPFRRWDGVSELQSGSHRIPVPPPDAERAAVALDLVVVPLVAFGPGGVRLGRGGGHYDRTLRGLSAATPIVGLAYDVQEDEDLVAEPWDVPLDAVVTPTRALDF